MECLLWGWEAGARLRRIKQPSKEVYAPSECLCASGALVSLRLIQISRQKTGG